VIQIILGHFYCGNEAYSTLLLATIKYLYEIRWNLPTYKCKCNCHSSLWDFHYL